MQRTSVLPKNTAESTGMLPPADFSARFVMKLDTRTTSTDTNDGNQGGQSEKIE
jgi:hypothetical protein